jgi:phospholipid/cholesterol/gamma-HCH transport system permease protein
MATRGYTKGDEHHSDRIYRCVGSLTISRAATTERELDLMPEGMTIDLSGVERMDTVGAWLVYRAVRDRGAKVEGASPDVEGLLEQVRHADKPVRVVP